MKKEKREVGMEDLAKIVAWLGAAVFVFAYLVLLILQFYHLDSTGLEWNRRLELLNPLQSLAFAGAGVLLGTVVQKQATKDAAERADKNEKAATKGAKLAEEVIEEGSSSRAPKALKDLVPVAKEIAEAGDP